MKRFLGACAVLVAATLAFSAAPAHAVSWREVQAYWATSTPDTTFITDEGDSDFVEIQTGDWFWPVPGDAAASSPFVCAHLTFTVQTSNVAADTIYYVPQIGVPLRPGSTTVLWQNWPAGPTAAAGNCAVVQQGFGGTSNVLYTGVLLADADAIMSALNVYGAKRLRLRVQGDQGGSTPKLSGVRVMVRYPQKTTP